MRPLARAAACLLLALPGVHPVAAQAASVTVVVTLADSLSGVPMADRADAIQAAQRDLLTEVGGPTATDVRSLRTSNVMVARVTPAQRDRLARDPRVAAVGTDAPLPRTVGTTPPTTRPAGAATPATAPTDRVRLPPAAVPAQACTGTQAAPQLEPEALPTLRVRSDDPAAPTAAALGYDGAGVTVGIVTTDLDPDAPNFVRADGRPAVVDYQAYVADGTRQTGEAVEAFGDVSSVIAQGTVTYDLADVVDPDAVALPGGHCWIRVVGTAPGADVVATNMNDGGVATSSVVLSINHAVAAGVDILSESFGNASVPDTGLQAAIQAANDAAIDAGVTVIVSSGDAGSASTVNTPATDPRAVAVGASTNARAAVQSGVYGVPFFGNGSWRNGTTSVISSAGITQDGRTIDVVAPEDSGWATCSADPRFTDCADLQTGAPSDLVDFNGTSQATPFVAGVAALIVQAYRDGHGGADPTPEQVKHLLTSTAGDLGLPADQQGAGQVDAYAAVLAARNLPTADRTTPVLGGAAPVAPGATLVATDSQFALDGAQRSTLTTTVTNAGTAPVTLTPALTVDEVDTTRRTTHPVNFAPDDPVFVGAAGDDTMSRSVPITVPAGTPWVRLSVNSVPLTAGQRLTTRMALFTPDGTLAGFGGAFAGYRSVVPAPEPGTWTAVLQTIPGSDWTGTLVVDVGTRTTVAIADPVTVAAGSTVPVTVTLPASSTPGDTALTWRIGPGLTIPVIRRVPLDLHDGSATVTAPVAPSITRSPFQTATWEIDVPAGHGSLTAGAGADGVILAATGVLVGPDGTARSVKYGTGAPDRDGLALTQTVSDPAPGRWRYTLLFWGAEYAAPTPEATYTVGITLDGLRPHAEGLPTGQDVDAGSTIPVRLTVTNPAAVPIGLRVDARTSEIVPVTLPALPGDTVTLPAAGAGSPSFTVPFFTSTVTATATGDVPFVLELTPPLNSPDVLAAPGRAVGLTVGDGVSPGLWLTALGVPGPVGATRSPSGTAQVQLVATTPRFDTSVTDANGQPFVTDTGLSTGITPVIVTGGSTGTVDVQLPVTAAPGETVTGTLALVTAPAPQLTADSPAGYSTGDVIAVFPYAYTVAAPTPTPLPDPTTEATPTTSEVTTPTAPTPSASVTPPSPTTTSSVSGDSAGPLARTGDDTGRLATWGVLLLAAGAALLAAARRGSPRRR